MINTTSENTDLDHIRKMALTSLKNYGIEGGDIYLIDLIPLIEIIWADGKLKQGELAILKSYIPKHVHAINTMADDDSFMTVEQARQFVLKYLKTRPEAGLLKSLRELVSPIRYTAQGNPVNDEIKKSILNLALDIASEAVTGYAYQSDERFNNPEKKCFFEIMDTLCGRHP